MDITSYSRDQIKQGLREEYERQNETNDNIRMLFAPERINDGNFQQACNIYSRLDMSAYETVVIVESYDEKLDKKLPMASNSFFETPLGKVPVNDYLRNEFCDEEDDFFIHDNAFHEDMSLFQQLMFLKSLSDDFSALSVQIADTNPAIVKELAHVLEVVLASRNALIVFCCDLDNSYKNEFEQLLDMVWGDKKSTLMNYLNRGKSHVSGVTSFMAGLMVAQKWELDLNFLQNEYDDYSGSLLTAYADLQRVIF